MGSLGLCFLLLLAGPARLAAQDNASRLFPGSADSGWPAPSKTPLTSADALSLRATEPAYWTQPCPTHRLLSADSSECERRMAFAGPTMDAAPQLEQAEPRRPTGTPLTSADALSLRATEPAYWTQPCPTHRLRSADSSECERRMAFADPTMDAAPQLEQAEAELPRWAFLERHRLLLSILIPITSIVAVSSNALIGYNTNHSFRIHHEGWFGRNTTNGGADKASHLTDYFIIANLFQDVYRMLGHSENAAILWGFGVALATGLANEVSDGFTHHGFSWEDLAMDAAGAAAASVVSATRTKDLLGMRTSHLPGSTYNHDVYSADFKISGLGQRLGVNIGPLRWLLVSVTYGVKGYRGSPTIEPQRQVGFEVGLNLQQILNDLGVKRNTWWGYSLHLLDNIRFPFTAVGMRLDLNRGKWHGPNSGNYD